MGKNALLSFIIKSVTKRPVMVSKYITTLKEKKIEERKGQRKKPLWNIQKHIYHLPLRVIHILEHSGKQEKIEMK